jgi:hypothetical protein
MAEQMDVPFPHCRGEEPVESAREIVRDFDLEHAGESE